MKQFHFSVLIGFTNFKFEVQLSFLKYFLQGGQIYSRNFMLASKYLRAKKNVGQLQNLSFSQKTISTFAGCNTYGNMYKILANKCHGRFRLHMRVRQLASSFFPFVPIQFTSGLCKNKRRRRCFILFNLLQKEY